MHVFEEYDRKQHRMEAALRMVTGQVRELRSEHEALCRCLHQNGFVLDLNVERSRAADNGIKQECRARFDSQEGISLEPNAMSKPPSVAEEQISATASSALQQQLQGQLNPLQGKLPFRSQAKNGASRQKQKQQPQHKLQQLPQHVPQQSHRQQFVSQTTSQTLMGTRHKEQVYGISADDVVSPPQSPRGNACASPHALPGDNNSNTHGILNFQISRMDGTRDASNTSLNSSPKGSPRAVSSSKVVGPALGVAHDLHELVCELVGEIPAKRGQNETLMAVQHLLKKPRALQAWRGEKHPLLMAVEAGRADLARLLLKAHADPQVHDPQGVPLLHLSAFEGHQDITRQLLLAHAEPNCTDCHGQTPIFFAPDIKICRILMEASADLTIVNTMGQSALHLAALAGLSDVFAWLSTRMDQTLVWLEDGCHTSAMQYAHEKGLVSNDGNLILHGNTSGKQLSGISSTYSDAKRSEDKSAYASPSSKLFLDEIVMPSSKSFKDARKPDEKRRTIKSTLLSKRAQADAAEDAQYRARVTLRHCNTMPNLGDQLPIMTPLDMPRFSPKQAAGPGRPKSLPRVSTGETSAKREKSPPSAKSSSVSQAKQELAGGVICTSIHIPQQPKAQDLAKKPIREEAGTKIASPRGQHTPKAKLAPDSETYRISVPARSELGFRVVQHLKSPLTVDRIDQSRKDLHRIRNGDVVLAINHVPVANLDDYNKYIKLASRQESVELKLRRTSARDKHNPDPSHASSGRRTSGQDSIGSAAAFSDIGVLEVDEVDDWAQLGFDEFSPPPRVSNSSAFTLDWGAVAQSGSDAPDSPKAKKKKSARKKTPSSPRPVVSSSADAESLSSGIEQLWEPGELTGGDFTEDTEDAGDDPGPGEAW